MYRFFAALLLASALHGQITVKFGPESFTTMVEGTPVNTVGSGTVRLFTPPGQKRVEVEVTSLIDLSALQLVVPGIVQRKGNRNDDCSEVVRLHTVDVRASAEVYVAGHYERWTCAIGKNRLFEQNGDVTITLAIVIADQGRKFVVNAAVKDIHADGAIGGLLSRSVVGPYLTDWLKAKIVEALDPSNLKASFPAGLSAYHPAFTSARFVDLGSGKLGAAIAATFSVDQDQAQTLLQNLRH